MNEPWRASRRDGAGSGQSAARATRLSAVERRRQLAVIAAQRFHELGYHGVSLSDVAATAGITGPGIYRHFESKEALLAAAITSGLDLVDSALSGSAEADVEQLVAAMARVAVLRPDMWVLLQRESRFLSRDLRAVVQARFTQTLESIAQRVRQDRPELTGDDARLLATAATSVLSLPATSASRLTTEEYRRELTAAGMVCLAVDLRDPPAGPVRSSTGPDVAELRVLGGDPHSRRAQIVDVAVELFFRYGFTGVSLDDIGATAGMAGPSILHHFPTKADVLATAFDRTAEGLALIQTARRAQAQTPDLDGLVDSYVRFALANRELVGIFVTEPLHVPPSALENAQAVARRERRDWTRALLASDLDLDEPVARMRVAAALTAINDLIRLGHLHERPRIRDETDRIALAVLRGHA